MNNFWKIEKNETLLTKKNANETKQVASLALLTLLATACSFDNGKSNSSTLDSPQQNDVIYQEWNTYPQWTNNIIWEEMLNQIRINKLIDFDYLNQKQKNCFDKVLWEWKTLESPEYLYMWDKSYEYWDLVSMEDMTEDYELTLKDLYIMYEDWARALTFEEFNEYWDYEMKKTWDYENYEMTDSWALKVPFKWENFKRYYLIYPNGTIWKIDNPRL